MTSSTPSSSCCRGCSEPGALVVDAGAAIGQFTVLAGRVPGVAVHAYEPSSANIASLHRNLEVNGIAERVTVHQAALSSEPGEATFHTSANTYLSGLGADAGGGTEETVPVRTVDGELERLGIEHVHVLKVNVAGFEAGVLRGALGSLARGAVSVLLVLIGDEVVPVLREVADLGYRFYFYVPASATLHPVVDLSPAGLACPPSPARHVIGLHSNLVASLSGGGVTVLGG